MVLKASEASVLLTLYAHFFFLVVTHSEPFSWILCSVNQPGTSRFSCLVGLESWKLPTYLNGIKESILAGSLYYKRQFDNIPPHFVLYYCFVVDFSKMRPISIRCSSMLIYESRFLLNFASSHIFFVDNLFCICWLVYCCYSEGMVWFVCACQGLH